MKASKTMTDSLGREIPCPLGKGNTPATDITHGKATKKGKCR